MLHAAWALHVQAVWLLKCQALTEKMWIDDTEMEEEGVAEMLLDENETAQAPRCVTPAAAVSPARSRRAGPAAQRRG